LQRRDRIEAVNGAPLPFDDLVALREVAHSVSRLLAREQLPDDPGGPITLTVRSPGEEPREVDVGRDTGEAPIVPSGMRLPQDSGIGYLLVPDFVTPDLQERVIDILEEMLDEGDLDGLILDLRANPGGSVGILQTFLGLFVEGNAGTFYHRDGRLPEPIRIDRQEFAAELEDVPLVVLTDNQMYSASEVATAILQSRERATVVGVTSPGDVEVLLQSFYDDGSSLFLVRSVFVLPGALVEGVGNIPDVPVLLNWTDYAFEDDPQILAGIETIRSGDTET
jgi:carboxyl-terminal processing protease